MNAKHDFNDLYSDVSDSIAAAMADISAIKVEHKDGKQEVINMMGKLRSIQDRFDSELALLDKSAEWDKFTLAFFGETNAGKSTIIESLRIIFQEESRQELLRQNAYELVQYEKQLEYHVKQVSESIKKIYVEYITEIIAIKQSTVVLSRVLQDESARRLQLEHEESARRLQLGREESARRLQLEHEESARRLQLGREESARRLQLDHEESARRLQLEHEESASRLQLAQLESSERIKRKLWLYLIGGIVVGGTVSAVVAMLLGM